MSRPLSSRALQALLERAAVEAAAESRRLIEATPPAPAPELTPSLAPMHPWCALCQRRHPATFTFKGRSRGWHQEREAQMSPAARRARKDAER